MRSPYSKIAISKNLASEIDWKAMSLRSIKYFFIVLTQIFWGTPKYDYDNTIRFKVSVEKNYIQKILGTNVDQKHESSKLKEWFAIMNKQAFGDNTDLYLAIVSETTSTEIIFTILRPEEVSKLDDFIPFKTDAVLNCNEKYMIPAYIYLAKHASPPGYINSWNFSRGEFKRMFGFYLASDYTKIPNEYIKYKDFYDDFSYWYETDNDSNDYFSELSSISLNYGFSSFEKAKEIYLTIKEKSKHFGSVFEKQVADRALKAINESGMLKIHEQLTETNGNQKNKNRKEFKLYKRIKDNAFTIINEIKVKKIVSYNIRFEKLDF